MRPVIGCVCFLLLTGQAAPPVSPVSHDNFCARLAANSGIEPPKASSTPTEWTVNAMSFGKRVFVGGSYATGIGAEPIEPATVEDYRRMKDMCLPEGRGAVCKLVGPLNFKFIWKGRKLDTPMKAGERATILVKGSKTTCSVEA